jgi:integrase
MASISKDKNGTRRIVYYNAVKKQVSIRLGNVPMKDAQTIKVHVENLLSAQAMGVSVTTETAEWLAKIPDQLHQKFVQKGFIPPRRVVGTLGEMIPKVIKDKEQSVDAKTSTLEIYGQAEESLYRHFGKDRQVDTITTAEAREFCRWLEKNGRLKNPGALAQSTVAKRMQHVISFFGEMVKTGDIPCNPFTGIAKKATIDERRNQYISEETILKVMEYAPDAEWRLIIALWRFAGLRAVSEVLMLKWTDILWDQRAIMVHSPKTEHHGKAFRKIPFFPHIEECLTEAFEQAPEGSIYVVEKHAPRYLRGQKERIYISRQGNIGTMFRKIIHKAGIAPWTKLIQNLRASFETDLLNGEYGEFGIHTIAEWLGHSPQVMLKHYGRYKKSDNDKIAQACEQVRQRKKQMRGGGEDNFAPVQSQNDGLTVEMTGSPPQNRASLKASLYTAAEGEIECNGAETRQTLVASYLPQTLENTVLDGNIRQDVESCASRQKYLNGRYRIRTYDP